MVEAPVIQEPATPLRNEPKLYRCGTLTYTKAGLLVVGAWLLWGDFCLMLMETVIPSIIPLKLKALGAQDWVIGLVVSTIPSVMGMTICPYISFKSDRHRGPLGRRIPFIVYTMPFLCASIVLLGLSEDISSWVYQRFAAAQKFAPATVTVFLIAVFMGIFQFFNMFVGSVFWYLFNDVFPAQFLGRLIGALRVVGMGAVTLYNFFIFRYAESHSKQIFIGAAVLYMVGFGLMCWKVREGKYPPVEGESEGDSRGLGGIKTFVRESYSHPFYWLLFLGTAFNAIVVMIVAFQVFFFRNMGLSLDQVGKYNAYLGIAAFAAVYFSAVFIDRWHPLRVGAYVSVFSVATFLGSWVWVFVDFPPRLFFWLFLSTGLLTTFQVILAGAASQPRDMRLFPRSRYGQFSSAQAILRSIGLMFSGVLAGLYFDLIKPKLANPDLAYRFMFAWQTAFSVLVAIVSVMAYRKWYDLGGDSNYRSPAPWSADGVEDMPTVRAVGPQSRWLNLSLRLFHATIFLSLLGAVTFALIMHRRQESLGFRWFAYVLAPVSALVWIWWILVERSIRADMSCAKRQQPLRNGLPHHGVLMVIGLQSLVALGLWGTQIGVSLRLGQQNSAIVFGVANVVTNLLLVAGVQLMACVERGHLVTLDATIEPVSNAEGAI